MEEKFGKIASEKTHCEKCDENIFDIIDKISDQEFDRIVRVLSDALYLKENFEEIWKKKILRSCSGAFTLIVPGPYAVQKRGRQRHRSNRLLCFGIRAYNRGIVREGHDLANGDDFFL